MDWLTNSVIDHLREAMDAPDLTGASYVLGKELGRGGMGIVYEARDTRLGRTVALKVLSPLAASAEAVERLWREARILASLEHPGIVPIHDAGMLSDGRAYYAMKLVEGSRLDEYLQAGPSVLELCRVFLRICEPVAFAHARGIVHRDLKPENIMLGKFGEVLVLDWGVATALGESERPGLVIGTPGYMAPEQSEAGPVDARADVYSLGNLLREAVGTAPPRALRSIVKRATELDPARRYQTVAELSGDVASFLDHQPVNAHRENWLERAARVLGRHKTLAWLIVAYLVVRVLLFFFVHP
jgi:serine/threonine protein kinase